MKNVLEEHAPNINRLIKPRPHSPWYTESLRVMKRELRRLERRSKKTLLNIHREIFKARRGGVTIRSFWIRLNPNFIVRNSVNAL